MGEKFQFAMRAAGYDVLHGSTSMAKTAILAEPQLVTTASLDGSPEACLLGGQAAVGQTQSRRFHCL